MTGASANDYSIILHIFYVKNKNRLFFIILNAMGGT